MKFALAFAAILAVASAQYAGFSQPRPAPRLPPTAAPPRPAVSRSSSSDQAATIVRYDNDIRPDGTFSYTVQTDNGIGSQAQGTPRDFGGNPPIIPVVIQGSFSYTSPEGKTIVINYIADENGYQPTGDSIPTSPPIPEAIARSIEYLSKNQKK